MGVIYFTSWLTSHIFFRGDKHSSKKESDSEHNLDNEKDRSRSHSPEEADIKPE